MTMQIETAGIFLVAMAGLVLVIFIWLQRQDPRGSRRKYSTVDPKKPDPKGSGSLSGSYAWDDSYSPTYRSSDKGGLPLGKRKKRKKTETYRRHSED